MTDFPALTLLLQGYLNLDWPDDYESVWAAVDHFARREPVAAGLALEVDALLAQYPTEVRLDSSSWTS